MQEDDLKSVLEIENQIYSHPWSMNIFVDCLRGSYYCQLYEIEDEIFAYSIVSVVAGEAHLLNLSVHPLHQGKGLGREVLKQIIRFVRGHQASTLFLEVRVSNKVACNLYESEGFNEIGQRFDYYPAASGREDALVFALPLL
jgi:ribosomal-protein-alanine N-acetyltransferase